MYTCRNHIGNIYFEFLKHPQSKRCFIICDGILNPNPSKQDLMISLYQRWYSSVAPRYEGTRESKGEFLDHPPHQDILHILKHFQTTKIQGTYNRECCDFREEEFILLGLNFWGTISLKIAEELNIKIIAFSPLIYSPKHHTQWKEDNTIFVGKFLKEGFWNGYRFSDENWEKFAKGWFLDLSYEKLKNNKHNILIISDPNEVFFKRAPIDEFSSAIGIKHLTIQNYCSIYMNTIDKNILKIIENFLNS